MCGLVTNYFWFRHLGLRVSVGIGTTSHKPSPCARISSRSAMVPESEVLSAEDVRRALIVRRFMVLNRIRVYWAGLGAYLRAVTRQGQLEP